MNLVLLHPEDFLAQEPSLPRLARLTGRRARHVFEVHRVTAGESLTVGELNGRIGAGVVRAVSAEEVTLEVALDREPPAPHGIDLLLAFPRPKMLRRVLAAATSMGVKRIVLVNSFRVEKSYFGSPLAAPDAIREHLINGLEQGRDTVLPEVTIEKRFKPFVEDRLEALWPSDVFKLAPHPTPSGGLESCRVGRAGEKAVLAIGPEGGWIPYEIEMLRGRGFQVFSLGERILRVDTAVPYAVGQLLLARSLAPAG